MQPLLLIVPFALVLAVTWIAEHMIERHDDDASDDALPTGEEIAKAILARHGVRDVRIDAGEEDFYAPLNRRIELSSERIFRRSTSGAAIAAHEAAHALQHARRWPAFRVSVLLAIPGTLASLAWFPLAVAAAILGSDDLAVAAFALFGFTVAAGLLTVAIEVDASRRALDELHRLAGPALDQRAARHVLLACGATYVTGALVDLGFVARRLRRDDEHDDLMTGVFD